MQIKLHSSAPVTCRIRETAQPEHMSKILNKTFSLECKDHFYGVVKLHSLHCSLVGFLSCTNSKGTEFLNSPGFQKTLDGLYCILNYIFASPKTKGIGQFSLSQNCEVAFCLEHNPTSAWIIQLGIAGTIFRVIFLSDLDKSALIYAIGPVVL